MLVAEQIYIEFIKDLTEQEKQKKTNLQKRKKDGQR
jgi:hypothetical protein